MSSHDSSTNAQKTVPAEYVPPMSLHRFCQLIGSSKASAWRYEKRGWLRTHLIANRRYILAADVAEFNRRFAADEFAGNVSNLFGGRSIKRKQAKQQTLLQVRGLTDARPRRLVCLFTFWCWTGSSSPPLLSMESMLLITFWPLCNDFRAVIRQNSGECLKPWSGLIPLCL